MAVREGVGLFDMTSFGKIRVEGRDAEAVLQRVCANDVAVAPGRIVYTQMAQRARRHRGDLTVTRLSETAFLVVTAGRDAAARPRLAAAPLDDAFASSPT
jgi:glycine cleavage system aminomethyltransferase T